MFRASLARARLGLGLALASLGSTAASCATAPHAGGPLPAPDLIHFGFGRFSIYDRPFQRSPELNLEYRFGEADWLPWELPGLAPQIGTMRTARKETFTYVGLHWELDLGRGWHVTPQLDAGHYEQGDGRTLCRDLQFRSGLEFSYAISARMRIAVGLRHISNAGLAECNPGAESLLFGLQFAPFAP